ncbi:MAG: hypothetical protein ACFFG0_09890, partial [Candidatus Thorarchaeota archaeon]
MKLQEEDSKDFKHVFESLKEKVSEKRRKIYRIVSSQFPDIKLNRLNLKKNLTITHGDVWLGNFLFPKLNNKYMPDINHQTYLTDWETWSTGFGPNDVAHMIGLNWDPEIRESFPAYEPITKLHFNCCDVEA